MLRYLIKLILPVFIFISGLSLPSLSQAASFGDTLLVGSETLQLNGSGTRKKAFIKIYDVALYLPKASQQADAIVSADESQAIALHVLSKLATAKKITAAFKQGIVNSTNGQTTAIHMEMQQFLEVFSQGVRKGDQFQFVYTPKGGTVVMKNGEEKTSIAGHAFKQALFGIWLSAKPVTDKLKQQLLGS